MSELMDLIARGDKPYAEPIIGYVVGINTNPPSVDVAITPNAPASYPLSRFLDSYAPVLGHVVFGLRHPKYGVMIFGRYTTTWPPSGSGGGGAQGPQGIPGPTGPAGPAGPQGSAGPAGATGAQGAPGPTGPVGPAGSGTADMPVGAIIAYGGSAAPTGWALCDGAPHGSAALQAVLGSANTPDLRSRFIVGAGTGPGLTARAAGSTGGEESHILTIPEMPSHDHSTQSPVNFAGAGALQGTQNVAQGLTGRTGGGQPHNNMPPFYALTYIIKT